MTFSRVSTREKLDTCYFLSSPVLRSLFSVPHSPLPAPFFQLHVLPFTKIANGTCNHLLNARSYVYIVKQTCRMGSVMCQRNDE